VLYGDADFFEDLLYLLAFGRLALVVGVPDEAEPGVVVGFDPLQERIHHALTVDFRPLAPRLGVKFGDEVPAVLRLDVPEADVARGFEEQVQRRPERRNAPCGPSSCGRCIP